MQKIVLSEKLAGFSDVWSPKVVGQVNDCAVKLVKIKVSFPGINMTSKTNFSLSSTARCVCLCATKTSLYRRRILHCASWHRA